MWQVRLNPGRKRNYHKPLRDKRDVFLKVCSSLIFFNFWTKIDKGLIFKTVVRIRAKTLLYICMIFFFHFLRVDMEGIQAYVLWSNVHDINSYRRTTCDARFGSLRRRRCRRFDHDILQKTKRDASSYERRPNALVIFFFQNYAVDERSWRT